ncbi:MAG: addiction module antidote protein, HigA family [Candidatus Omnitrophota bacterium]|jgi:addiction module HigA family antidote|nr:MAG: addiction module antidote protein, HigA family [Candidatus Omnitrophota bacterium]
MIDEIKNEYHPNIITHPGETLLDLLEEKGISQKEFAEQISLSEKLISEIIEGITGITLEIANRMERILAVPAGFWMKRQRLYDECIARNEKRKIV